MIAAVEVLVTLLIAYGIVIALLFGTALLSAWRQDD